MTCGCVAESRGRESQAPCSSHNSSVALASSLISAIFSFPRMVAGTRDDVTYLCSRAGTFVIEDSTTWRLTFFFFSKLENNEN